MTPVSVSVECPCGKKMLIETVTFRPDKEEADVEVVFEGYCSVCGRELSHTATLRGILSTDGVGGSVQ